MRIQMIMLLVMGMIVWNACNDENDLTPTEGLEFAYTLPQGDHDYDVRIVDWNKRCGFYILYNFQPKDIYWGQEKWLGAVETDGEWIQGGLVGEPGDPVYVGEQLRFVEDYFLNYYPDSILRRLMPQKFLFCSKLEFMTIVGSVQTTDLNVFSGIDMIAINYGNEKIIDLDQETVSVFRDALHVSFLQRAVDAGKIRIPAEFSKKSSYGDYVSESSMYSEGFIGGIDDEAKIESDFKYYLEAIVTTSYTELTAEPKEDDYSYQGILHPNKDVKELVISKYKIIIDYFKEKYGINLQEIGNKQL